MTMPLQTLGLLLTTFGLAGLLWGEASDRSALRAITKPVATLGFIVASIGHGALESRYGQIVFLGLILGALGDVFLLGSGRKAFIAGLVSFLLGHVAYVVAFGTLDVDLRAAAAVALPVAIFMLGIARWVFPHAPEMRLPIAAYMLVISLMLIVAIGAGAAGAPAIIPIGATLFTVSDITVVRHRFVKAEASNRLVGLPMYYVAQLLIAWSIATVGS